MAILTAEELALLRQAFERAGNNGPWLKSDLNNASQAIEDWWEANRASAGAAIDAATTPLVLTGPQKKNLGKHWLKSKFGREG